MWPLETSMFVIRSIFVSSLLQTGGVRDVVCPKFVPTRHDEVCWFLMHISLSREPRCMRETKTEIKTFPRFSKSFPLRARRNDTTLPPLALLQLQLLFFLSLFFFSLSLYAVENLYSYQKVGVSRFKKNESRRVRARNSILSSLISHVLISRSHLSSSAWTAI